ISSASHGDNGPYHGWVIGYKVPQDNSAGGTMQLAAALNTTPNGSQGGIWMSGGKPAVDSLGNLYVETGNGDFNQNASNFDAKGFPKDGNYGDSFIKLTPDPTTSPTNQNVNGWGLKVTDYFTPFNQAGLNNADADLGSGGPLVLPDSA